MIVVDSSALLAILLDEREAPDCQQALSADDNLLISAGSLTEMLIVAAGKNLLDAMQAMLAALHPTVVPLTEAAPAPAARRTAAGARVPTPPPSTSVIASPTPLPASMMRRSCSSATTSPGPT